MGVVGVAGMHSMPVQHRHRSLSVPQDSNGPPQILRRRLSCPTLPKSCGGPAGTRGGCPSVPVNGARRYRTGNLREPTTLVGGLSRDDLTLCDTGCDRVRVPRTHEVRGESDGWTNRSCARTFPAPWQAWLTPTPSLEHPGCPEVGPPTDTPPPSLSSMKWPGRRFAYAPPVEDSRSGASNATTMRPFQLSRIPTDTRRLTPHPKRLPRSPESRGPAILITTSRSRMHRRR